MPGSDPAETPRQTSRVRWLVVLVALLALVAFAVYWLAPPRPYASLPIPQWSNFLLFSPDGGTLITAGGASGSRKPGPLRV